MPGLTASDISPSGRTSGPQVNELTPAPLQARPALSRGSKILLGLAILFHLSLLVSWRVGFWNRFTFDSTATRGTRGWDFYALYQAGHNVLSGVSAYESDGDKIEVVAPYYTPFRYLPISAYTLGVLLNLLSPLWAFRLWVATTELVLLGCAFLSWRAARDANEGTILAVMWLCFTPYYLEIYLGQFSVVQGALILLMMLCAIRPPLGWRYDLAWVASLLWKQNTGLFLPLFLRLRRWRGLGLGALAVLVSSLPYFILYPSALSAFLGNLRSGAPSAQLGNLGMRQFLYSAASALMPRLSPATHQALQQAWVLAVLGIGLYLTMRDAHPDILLHLCLWTTTYFLVYHQVWEHHYVLLLPVLVMLYRRTRSWTMLGLYVLIAIWTPYVLIDPQGLAAYHAPMRWTPLEPRSLDALYHASKALPTLALWGYIIWLIRQSRSSTNALTILRSGASRRRGRMPRPPALFSASSRDAAPCRAYTATPRPGKRAESP